MAPSRSVPVAAVFGALVMVVAVGAFALTSGTAAAQVDGDGGDRGVRVVGVGTATGVPDVLRFSVGVETTADTVDAALSSANRAATRMTAALRERGVAQEDLQTASVQLHPRYGEQGQQIDGYVARQDLVVTARDLTGAGALISAAVEAGGDAARLSGVDFALEDDEALLAEARADAYAKARDKAEQYARLAGKQLGEVASISEDVGHGPMPYARAGADLAMAESTVPLSPGSTEVTVSVSVRWTFR